MKGGRGLREQELALTVARPRSGETIDLTIVGGQEGGQYSNAELKDKKDRRMEERYVGTLTRARTNEEEMNQSPIVIAYTKRGKGKGI